MVMMMIILHRKVSLQCFAKESRFSTISHKLLEKANKLNLNQFIITDAKKTIGFNGANNMIHEMVGLHRERLAFSAIFYMQCVRGGTRNS